MGYATTPDIAQRFAQIALGHVTQPFPSKLDHVITGPEDLRAPRDLHPVFFGSFDWHSCVHGFWLLAKLYRQFPELLAGRDIRSLLDRQLTDANVAGELDYVRQPMRAGFERPYGWAWLLMLSAELLRHQSREGRGWAETLRPLTDAFVERFLTFLPKATYPIRSGAHFNTAFALRLALEYAAVAQHDALRDALCTKAHAWYGADADCQTWEPSGDDFLSPTLMEAECMRLVLEPADFAAWLSRFLPRLDAREPATLFVPAVVSDRSDGKIAHLDGLNFSRAWCWRSIASTWPDHDRRRAIAMEVAEAHVSCSLDSIAGDYMGEHWLATFALLALDSGPTS
jgi:hypothetical protein